MKGLYILTLASLLFLAAPLTGQPENKMYIYFPTTGNCYLCKVRIENAVNTIAGIESVNWDAETDVTYVNYDETLTDAYEIMQKIAFVGHETEWYPANDSAYNSLKNTCCYYTKVINYSNVQPGYLGMMGIWVWQLTGTAEIYKSDVKVNALPAEGLFSVSGLPEGKRVLAEAYTLNGQLIHTETISSSPATIDMRQLNAGMYVLVLTTDGQTLGSFKIHNR